jgi:2-amino-4-hydroxy-6-hydroxymethyldihydropteridine diphosphokinase
MNKVFLLLGSNVGNRERALSEAIGLLQEAGSLISFSCVYQTAAWGKSDQPDFLNQVIILETVLSAENLLKKVLEIEIKLGRVRSNKWAERTIDIDILYSTSGNSIPPLYINTPH